MKNIIKKLYLAISGRPELFFITAALFVTANFIVYFPGNNIKDYLGFMCLLLIFTLIMFIISRIGLSNSKISLSIVILLSAGLFLYKYGGVKYFNSFVFRDDFPFIYWVTEQGINMLWQGGVFGWNSTFFGGYYNLVDTTANLAFFVFPFSSIFGLKTGLNIFYFLIFISFPPIFYIYSRTLTNNIRMNVACLYMSFFVLCTFFLNTLIWGNIEVFLGIELLVINLTLCELFLKRKKMSGFLLVASLTFTLFAHAAFFLYSLLIIFIRIALERNMKNLIRYTYVLIFISLSTLPFTYPLVKYSHYFFVDANTYVPFSERFALFNVLEVFKNGISQSFKQHFFNWADIPILVLCKSYVTIFSVISPLFLYLCLFQKSNFKKSVSSLIISSLIIVAFKGLQTNIINRIDFVFPVLIILGLGYFFALYYNKIVPILVLSFVVVYCFLFPPQYIFTKIDTISSMHEYNAALIGEIKKLTGNLIIFEQRGSWNHLEGYPKNEVSEKPIYDIHFEALIARETKKTFFSGFGEGPSIHVDKYNTVISGTYKGKKVSSYNIEFFNELFRKWGIEYLVLWTNESKKYFSKYENLYEKIWSRDEWDIYRYKSAKPESVTVRQGYGLVDHQDFYKKILYLNNMKKGEKVLLKSNYFPAWRMYFYDKEIHLEEKDRQVSFCAPEDGTYAVRMVFSKNVLSSILGILSLFLSFVLSFRKYY